MVAQQLPAMPPTGVVPASTVATPAADASADFSAILSQTLDSGATLIAEATPATVALPEKTDDSSDVAVVAASDFDAAAFVTALPFVAEMAQSASGIKVQTGTSAARADAQLQAAATVSGVATLDAQDLQLQLPRAASTAVPSTPQQTQLAKDQQIQAPLTQAIQLQNVADSSANDASLASNTNENQDQPTDQGADRSITGLVGAGLATELRTERTELFVQARVGTPAWHDEVGAKLTWMVDRGVQHGTLRLSPENLGPMEVRITTQNDQVSVWFGAAHADTRAALENALPRLREMFAAQGLALADAGVFREPPKDTPRGYQGQRSEIASVAVEERVVLGRRDGLLDAYA